MKNIFLFIFLFFFVVIANCNYLNPRARWNRRYDGGPPIPTPMDPPPYFCDPQTCVLPNCRCASNEIPGNLSPENTPQFITMTFDDSFENDYLDMADDYFSNPTARDASNCPPKGVFYIWNQNTNYWAVQRAKARYFIELAVHTVTHTSPATNTADWIKEVGLGRGWLSQLTQTPLSEIVGFRFPFLFMRNMGYEALMHEGMLYDSTIPDYIGWGKSTNSSLLTWPYTLDHGSPQVCWTGDCVTGNFTGLWEIPMMVLYTESINLLGLMDAQASLDALKFNFDLRYNGNRAPFGIYDHLTPSHAPVMREFWEYAASKPGVFFVTNKELIAWMKDPVDIATTAARLAGSCNPANLPPVCSQPVTCNYGEPALWSFQTCGQCYVKAPEDLFGDFTLVPTTCGNGVCDVTDSCETCPVDCGACPTTGTTGTTATTGTTGTTGTTATRTAITTGTTATRTAITTGTGTTAASTTGESLGTTGILNTETSTTAPATPATTAAVPPIGVTTAPSASSENTGQANTIDSPSNSVNLAAIVVPVVGGIVLISVGVAACVIFYKKYDRFPLVSPKEHTEMP